MLTGNNKTLCEDEFLKAAFYLNNDTFLIYNSIHSEPDTSLLIKAALNDNKTIYLPKVNGERMDFYSVTVNSEFKTGSFNIIEPESGKLFTSGSGVCIVPGLSFDKNGYRLGYGKGYYDKFLSEYPQLIKIGFCAGCNFVDSLPADKFDIPVDYIFSDNNLIEI